MSIIYKIVNPKNQVYIGSTSQKLTNRKAEHKYRFKNNGKGLIYESFLKYGFESHLFEEIENVGEQNRFELEHFIIKTFDTKLNQVKNHNNTAQNKKWVNDGINEFQIYEINFNNYNNINYGRINKFNLGRKNNNNNEKKI